MHRYQVIDRNLQDRSIAFIDAGLAYHVARANAEMPSVGDVLEGRPPQLGSAVLAGPHGHVFSVIFDLVRVQQGDAFDRLHASLLP